MSGTECDSARLLFERDQERETKEMLEESVSDLRSTLWELQERLHSVDGEGNEWKTRYETQMELNGQLERQIAIVREKLEDLRGNPMDRLASIRSYDDMTVDTLQRRLKLLTDEKSELRSQLMDCRVRVEQEGKAFLKTNDERRAYLSEIAKLSSTSEANRRQYCTRPPGAPGDRQKRPLRDTHVGRRLEAGSKTEEPRAEERGGGGGGGGGRRAQRATGSRLPTLKNDPQHNS